MRSLQLLPHTEAIDGIQRAALDLCRGLAAEGDEPTVLVLGHGNNVAAWEEVADLREATPFLACSPRKPLAAARTARFARGLGGKYEVVVVNRLDMLNGAAIVAALNGAPLVFHAHNGPPPWLEWKSLLRVPGARSVRRLIVSSRYMAEQWRPVVGDLPIDVVEYPIDLTHFHPPTAGERVAARATVGSAADEFVVAFVGRFEESKGPHLLCAAVRGLHEDGFAIRLVLQGSAGLAVPAADAAAYRRRCVDLLGPCPATWVPPGPDVRPTIYASDVCVVPSIWQEPSGLVVAEGLATGTPVIASAVGGIPEQIPRSRQAALVPPDDVDGLVAALRAFRENPPSDSERQALRAHVEAARLPSAVSSRYRSALAS
jgi:glycosyltransferase involved in cell wall biosynthesis